MAHPTTSRLRFALACCVVLLAACSTTRFYPHEATHNEYAGKGGSRFTYEGIDIWFNGEPARRYEILGYIEDPRGLYADDAHRRVEGDVIDKAREIGADALIEVVLPGGPRYTSGLRFGGFGGFGGHSSMGMGVGFGIPMDERTPVKYTAVRYLDRP
ncbi:MAG: hypothetical protein REI09_06015 [Candidatus Dactylopiibacterium sp.]|nr:hypothetical protein [Candidatus Dactylopiibacterium sp.]